MQYHSARHDNPLAALEGFACLVHRVFACCNLQTEDDTRHASLVWGEQAPAFDQENLLSQIQISTLSIVRLIEIRSRLLESLARYKESAASQETRRRCPGRKEEKALRRFLLHRSVWMKCSSAHTVTVRFLQSLIQDSRAACERRRKCTVHELRSAPCLQLRMAAADANDSVNNQFNSNIAAYFLATQKIVANVELSSGDPRRYNVSDHKPRQRTMINQALSALPSQNTKGFSLDDVSIQNAMNDVRLAPQKISELSHSNVINKDRPPGKDLSDSSTTQKLQREIIAPPPPPAPSITRVGFQHNVDGTCIPFGDPMPKSKGAQIFPGSGPKTPSVKLIVHERDFQLKATTYDSLLTLLCSNVQLSVQIKEKKAHDKNDVVRHNSLRSNDDKAARYASSGAYPDSVSLQTDHSISGFGEKALLSLLDAVALESKPNYQALRPRSFGSDA
jgi:hypothetical protein